MSYKKLFEPIKIRGLELKNRVIFPAIRTKLAEDEGKINQQLIDYHVTRALGGTGLNIVEGTDISEYSSSKKYLSITKDDYIEDFKKLVDSVHEADGKIGIQLWHGWTCFDEEQNLDRLFPSKYELKNKKVLEELELEHISEIVKLYGQAAKRAYEAGFDVIDINASLGNTLHAFLSPAFNKRTDKYGGSLEKRAKLLIDVIKEIRENISEDMPIILTIVSKDDYLIDGLEVEDIIEISKLVEDAGVDVLNVGRGNIQTDAKKYTIPSVEIDKDFNIEETGRIKDSTDLIVTAMGKINNPDQAEKILTEEKSDLIAIGRGLLSDPEFCNKAESGDEDKIITCIGCNQGCYGGLVDNIMPHITCSRNPMVGKEKVYEITDTEKPEKIAVIGGGVGGMSAALILDARGHEVELFEQTDILGGQLRLSGRIPGKEEFENSLKVRIHEIEKSNIKLHMETEFIDKMISDEDFDRVIIATGADARGLTIPGSKLKNVHLFTDILKGKVKPKGEIAIIGGGFAGVGMAELLANQEDTHVTVLEEKKVIGEDLGELRRISVMENLKELGVEFKTSVELLEIKKDSLIYKEKNKNKELEIDHVIMAVGYNANKSNDIKQYCQDREIPFYVIGDALIPRRALDAISEAANISINEID